MSYIGNPPSYQQFLSDMFSGNGSTTSFTMSVAPANAASVLVALHGVIQDTSAYSVSGTTLTFTAAPPSGTNNINVRYLGVPALGFGALASLVPGTGVATALTVGIGSAGSMVITNGSNVVAPARLGSGTPSTSTFLRGDNTWAAPVGGVTSVDGASGAVTLSSLASFGVSLASAGYQKHPGGLILQWGTSGTVSVAANADASISFTFPITFPTAVLQVFLTGYENSASSWSVSSTHLSAQSTTGGTAVFRQPNNGTNASTMSAKFLAVGY